MAFRMSQTLTSNPSIAWENPVDGEASWAAAHGVTKNWTRLSDFTFTFSDA